MNRNQAAEFIHALNLLQPHVAPLLFASVAATDAVRIIAAIASGQTVCDLKPSKDSG